MLSLMLEASAILITTPSEDTGVVVDTTTSTSLLAESNIYKYRANSRAAKRIAVSAVGDSSILVT